MKIEKRKLPGVFEVTLAPHLDRRGFFMRTFDANIFREAALDRPWVQENHSRSESKGIIRGLHFQFPPYAETKLIRCIRGAVLDVFVDLRLESPTFGQWDAVELSESNKKMVFIPRGFAHGFCTLTKISEVVYKVDNVYNPKYESGILWSDPELNIQWPASAPLLSEKDQRNMTFQKFIETHKAIKL